MMRPPEAARSLLTRADGQHWKPGGSLVLAACSAVLECHEEQAGFEAALLLREPALALPAAAAAEAACPRARRARLAHLLSSADPAQRAAVLFAAEPFLVRIDPDWAAGLVIASIGADAALEHGIGLVIAARQRARGSRVAPWVVQAPRGSLLQRQFAADSLLGAAVRGERVDDADERWAGPLRDPDALLDTEASAVLAAVGLLEPARGLAFADRLLQSHSPHALQEALEIVAAAAVRDGQGSEVLARARRRGFVAEQAVWTRVAARAGAACADQVAALARALSPRVTDELDSGRRWIAGLPLLAALTHAGCIQQVADDVASWDVTSYELAQTCFATGDSLGAIHLTAFLQHDAGLFAGGDDEAYEPPGWWLDARGDPALQHQATLELLELARSPPWQRTPGTIGDIADLSRA